MRALLVCRLLVAVYLTCLCSCRSASSLPTVQVSFASSQIGVSESFIMQVAATPELRSKGLMFRRSLGRNEGMIFLFPQEQRLTFWMKNTLIPLDMVFVGRDWTVVGVVENATPQTEAPRYIDGNSQYVLEFNAGTAKRIGIHPGVSVRMVGKLPAVL